ncbi:MAG: type I restriction-modification enzyme R subunit C-terminal domain-containing protein [Singulisphaera sp.]
MIGQLDSLRVNLAQVKAVAPTIAQVRTADFWKDVTVARLEDVRGRLRGVTQYRLTQTTGSLPPKVIDVKEDLALVERKKHAVKLEGLQLAAYRNRVEKVLKALFETNETLQRIKRGQPVSESDLETLTSLVLTQDPMLDLHDLIEVLPRLRRATRPGDPQHHRPGCGGGERAVHGPSSADPTLNSSQIRFLDLLQNHIAKHGAIEVARLYEPPFTTLHTDSIDGLFPDEEQAQGIIKIVESFRPPKSGTAVA